MTHTEKGKPRWASLFYALATVVGVACSAAERKPQNAAPVQIYAESDQVALGHDGGVTTLEFSMTVTNTSTHAILLSECGMALERNQYIMAMDRRNDEWLEVWRPTCEDSTEARTTLQPGESMRVPVRVASRGTPSAFKAEPGVYRLRFFISSAIGGEYHQMPSELSISRSFTVVDDK